MDQQLDRLASAGNSIRVRNAAWSFSGDVAKTFDEHVAASVPQYREGHDLVVGLSDFFLADGSVCYELGSSTGTLIKRLAQHNESRRIKAIGIEIATDMVEFARQKCAGTPVSFVHADISDVELETADMIVAYYTIQFIRPRRRQEVINQIYTALNWGGAFVMFEKVRACDARFQDIMTSMYCDFKLQNNFSAEEIVAKARSLKGVLEPFSTRGNLELLQRAGFTDIITVMKYLCFEGFLAIK